MVRLNISLPYRFGSWFSANGDDLACSSGVQENAEDYQKMEETLQRLKKCLPL